VKFTKVILLYYGTCVRGLCENNHDLGNELEQRTPEIVIVRLQSARHQQAAKR